MSALEACTASRRQTTPPTTPTRFVNYPAAGEKASSLTPREFPIQNSNGNGKAILIARLQSETPSPLLGPPALTSTPPPISSPQLQRPGSPAEAPALSLQARIQTCQVHLSPALREDRPRQFRQGPQHYFKCCPGGIPFAMRRKSDELVPNFTKARQGEER